VWRDRIKYWVLSSEEVEENVYYSAGQHRGSEGEGQLHITDSNIPVFDTYEVSPQEIESAIRDASNR
jgi:hypothetical protein